MEEAIHNGDPAQRLEMWSTNDPVTLFGAWGQCKGGSDRVPLSSLRRDRHYRLRKNDIN